MGNQRVQFDNNFEDVRKCCRDKKQGSYDSFSLNFNFDGLEVKILPKKNNESEASAEVVLDSNDSNELITEVLRLAYSEGLEEKVADIYYKLGAASNENYEIYLKREFEYLLRIERYRLGVSIEDFKLWREGGGAYGENHIHDSWKVVVGDIDVKANLNDFYTLNQLLSIQDELFMERLKNLKVVKDYKRIIKDVVNNLWMKKYNPPVDAESSYMEYLGKHFQSIVGADKKSSEVESISFETLLRWEKLDSIMKHGSNSIQLIASIWIEIVGSTRDACNMCKFANLSATIDDLLRSMSI